MKDARRWAHPPMSISGPPAPTRRVGRAMAWGVAIGVGAVVLRELVRPREQSSLLIDWERVQQIALARSGEATDPPADLSRDQTYQQIAAELEPELTQALGPGSAGLGTRIYPGLIAVGRRQWVRFWLGASLASTIPPCSAGSRSRPPR